MAAPLATIIIPIGLYHIEIAQRAVQSAAAQTVACAVLPIVDDEGRGAGWARNRGIEQATTEFLVFLDADDQLMPNFVERCWSVFQQTQRYIYTDFLDDSGARHNAPDCPFTYRPGMSANPDPMANAHAVTTFVPTDWARQVDGFDEYLSGGEDSEFYIHLGTEKLCGTRLPEALFIYTNAPDSRSKQFRANGLQAYRQLIEERYEGKVMGCCQEPAKPQPTLDNAAPGLVLARPRWGGNRRERGVATGYLYPHVDKHQIIEVDPRDAAARPDLWEIIAPAVTAPPPPVPVYVAPAIRPEPDLQALARHALQMKPPPPQPPTPPPPAPIVPTSPNIERVARLAQNRVIPRSNDGGWHMDGTGSVEIYAPPPVDVREMPLGLIHTAHLKRNDDPVFVFPDKDYPSYTDVKRLVELSGFEIAHWGEFTYRIGRPSIFLSPEQPYFVNAPDQRMIWWSLEYGGEYEPDLSNWQGEVWASDPAWAKAHDAKMVVMGSHPDLKTPDILGGYPNDYDLMMLAYMTPRREVIKRQMVDLRWPAADYPGYEYPRHAQLRSSKFMLHVHQREDTQAIAPQRIALAAAYKLPLICESIPDAGEYGHYIPFIDYQNLNAETRSQLAMMDTGMPQARADMLYNWLCVEHTFRKSVEEALKNAR